ncbi:hypothetical protein UY9_09070 [Bacillus atrophaeus C89]|nr:hypothetical protein UY9_09070 [Bacillus atrophaeus C89]
MADLLMYGFICIASHFHYEGNHKLVNAHPLLRRLNTASAFIQNLLLSHFHYKNNSPVLMQINMTVRIFVKEMNT